MDFDKFLQMRLSELMRDLTDAADAGEREKVSMLGARLCEVALLRSRLTSVLSGNVSVGDTNSI